MTIRRTLYTFTFLVKFSDVNYFCIKCKYHINRILLRSATKRAQITPKILLMTKSTVFTLKILLLASKLTGHLVPRCRNNFQLCRGVAWAVLEKLWVTSCTMGAMGAVNKNVSSQIYQTNSGKPNPLNQIYQTKLTNPCILNK